MGKWGKGGKEGGGGGSKMCESHFGKRGGKGADSRSSAKQAAPSPQKEGGVVHAHKRAAFASNKCDSSAEGRGGIPKPGGGGGSQHTEVKFKCKTSGFLKNFTSRGARVAKKKNRST